MRRGALCLSACMLASNGFSQGVISIDAAGAGPKISPGMYGVFLEEISHAGEGGLYAELLQNRGFEDANLPPACSLVSGQIVPPHNPSFWTDQVKDWTMPWEVTSKYPGWKLNAPADAASLAVVSNRPLNQNKPHALLVDIANASAAHYVTVENEGFWGVGVQQGEGYDLRLWAQRDGEFSGHIRASIVSENGRTLATQLLDPVSEGKYGLLTARLKATATDPKAHFSLQFQAKAKGKVWLAYVSLFPEKTFKDRKNGLRPDLAKMISDLKPGFVRFPGGCYVEGITVEDRPQWQLTLGPLEQRTPTYSPWGYWNTNGFGYHEWLQFCEDIHAEPLYVFNVGVSCAFRSSTYLPDDQLPTLIQNTLDAIEYANGPVTSKWGAVRAKNGHPRPFDLKYVEIGNEQQGARYGKRVAMFDKALKAKYPKINVILSSWIAGIDHAAINAAGNIDIVDEHAYTPLNWSIWNFDSFAKYPRDVPWQLYIGEFACNGGVGEGNMAATLNDAAYMMSMEKNSDLVKMGSYAPLLQNAHTSNWGVNMIHFDSGSAYGRATYYACKMFADNLPSKNLTTKTRIEYPEAKPIGGQIGLGTFATLAEFKDLAVQQNGQPLEMPAYSTWSHETGKWAVEDGAFGQREKMDDDECFSFSGGNYHDIDLSVKARKIKGAEGFFVSVGDVDGMRVQVNFGGWGNRLFAVQVNSGSPVAETRGHIEDGRWYDVRIQTHGRTLDAFLDGKPVLHCALPNSNSLLAIAGRDEVSHEIVVKVVNNGPEPKEVSLNISGAHLEPSGKEIVLSSPDPNAENTFDQPKKITPHASTLNGVSDSFKHTFAPYSLTILRLKEHKS